MPDDEDGGKPGTRTERCDVNQAEGGRVAMNGNTGMGRFQGCGLVSRSERPCGWPDSDRAWVMGRWTRKLFFSQRQSQPTQSTQRKAAQIMVQPSRGQSLMTNHDWCGLASRASPNWESVDPGQRGRALDDCGKDDDALPAPICASPRRWPIGARCSGRYSRFRISGSS